MFVIILNVIHSDDSIQKAFKSFYDVIFTRFNSIELTLQLIFFRFSLFLFYLILILCHVTYSTAVCDITDLGETIMWETKCREDDMDVLSNKLLRLQDELSNLSDQKNVVQSKLFELDSLVGQLLLVNESLVARLAGKQNVRQHSSPSKTYPKSPNSNSNSTNQKLKNSRNSQNLSQNIPLNSRLSSSSSRCDEYKSDNGFQSSSMNDKGHTDLRNMHRMYVDLAKNINIHGAAEESKGGVNGRNQEPSLGPSSPSNYDDDYGDAFLSDLQQQQQQQQQKQQQQQQYIINEPSYEYGRSPPIRSDNRHDTNNNFGFSDNYSYDNSSPSSVQEDRVRTLLQSQDFGSVSDRGIAGVIDSLEHEFFLLSEQYKYALSNIKAKVPGSEIPLEEELISIIQRLHKKGEQLKTLKSPYK